MGLARGLDGIMVGSAVTTECWFLDVGQGSSHVILLGQGRAIVVDPGPTHSLVTLQLLKRYIDTIEALVVSHNDEDHDGGAAKIIQAYPKAIRQIYYLSDRPASQIRTYRTVKTELAAGNLLSHPRRIEATDSPQVLYEDQEHELDLRVIYPAFLDNQQAEEAGSRRANLTSAIIVLRCSRRTVVFGSDAQGEAWEAVAESYRHQLPLKCDICTVPHHGGKMLRRTAGSTRENTFVRHLWSQTIQPAVAIISVGSSNQYCHPLPHVVAALRNAGSCVLCTQMTEQCSSDLESIRPGLIPLTWPARSSGDCSLTGAGRSRNVGCASTVVAEVARDSVKISSLAQHQQALKQHSPTPGFHPLCVLASDDC